MMRRNLCMNCMAGIMRFGVCTSCGFRNNYSPRPERALPLYHELSNGRYVLGRVLGAGGFGITYLTWDCRKDCRVTIKELCPGGVVVRDSSSQHLKVVDGQEKYFAYLKNSFKREARMISLFQAYPEILKIYDAFEENGTVYYSMEYLEGEDLGKYAQRTGSCKWETYQKSFFDIIQSLRILHNHGLIHRDISPDNLFVMKNGGTKLIDFGSVRHDKADHFTTIFKCVFAPPEMHVSRGTQGPWTDIYSLCASIYYILSSGKTPASAYDRLSSKAVRGKDSLIPLRTFNPGLPRYLYDALDIGMSLDYNERFLNVNDLQKALFPRVSDSQNHGVCYLACIQGLYQGKKAILRPERLIHLGRGAGNDIAYPDNPAAAKGISRRHCAFYVDRQSRAYLQDQGSTYGTFLNGSRIKPDLWYRLPDGSRISIGLDVYFLQRH